MRRVLAGLLLLMALPATVAAQRDDAEERRTLVADIVEMFRSLAAETGQAPPGARVLAAMEKVPRHEFVPEEQRASAYRNRPLPIGHGQTISQPFIVALMTDLLQLKPTDRVLEVGTGSGYQAAVLSLLAKDVFSIEIIEPLGLEAAAVLSRLGYSNVTTRIGDGYQGWPEHAPYDAIIVTAAPDHVPPALIAQLVPGGRMVIPVGAGTQDLLLVEKRQDGTTVSTEIVPVRFVPLTRGQSPDPDPRPQQE